MSGSATMSVPESVIWHDLECGSYTQDLPLWLELAARYAAAPSGLVLEIGAGTGRVTLALARAGYAVVALDRDAELLEATRRRARRLQVRTVLADARDFELPGCRFSLCLVPMQTVQLLGGPAGRLAFLRAARRHLAAGGLIALALVAPGALEPFEPGEEDLGALPDVIEREGRVYSSKPIAVRREGRVIVLERQRETLDAYGARAVETWRVTLDLLTPGELFEAGQRAGLKPLGSRRIAASEQYAGSEVVLLGR